MIKKQGGLIYMVYGGGWVPLPEIATDQGENPDTLRKRILRGLAYPEIIRKPISPYYFGVFQATPHYWLLRERYGNLYRYFVFDGNHFISSVELSERLGVTPRCAYKRCFTAAKEPEYTRKRLFQSGKEKQRRKPREVAFAIDVYPFAPPAIRLIYPRI